MWQQFSRKNAVLKCIRLLLAVAPSFIYMFYAGYSQKNGSLRLGIGGKLFCEAQVSTSQHFFCQKASGLSSFAYNFAPVVIAWSWDSLSADEKTIQWFSSRSWENIVFACACIYLTIGNLAMHGFCAPKGHFLDATGMNLVLAFFCSYMLMKVVVGFINRFFKVKLTKTKLRIVYWSFLTFLALWSFNGPRLCKKVLGCPTTDFWGDMFLYQMAITCGAFVIAVMFFRNYTKKYIMWVCLVVVTMVTGYIIWLTAGQTDATTCNPDSWFQAHAIWHLLTGLGTLCAWIMVRDDPWKYKQIEETDDQSISSDTISIV